MRSPMLLYRRCYGIFFKKNVFMANILINRISESIPQSRNISFDGDGNNSIVKHTTAKWLTNAERSEFMSVLYEVVKDITQNPMVKENMDITKRLPQIVKYNVTQGRQLIALATIAFYKSVEDRDKMTEKNIRLINILGSCIQIMHTAFVITDDILDSAETRRGMPCWYLVEGVGSQAINDAVWLDSAIFMILKKYFHDHKRYVQILEGFQRIKTDVLFGQDLELICTRNGHLDYLNSSKYNLIVKYKSANPCKLPVTIASHLFEKYDETFNRAVCDILSEMGYYTQLQNDFLDCYGNATKTGKISTDIQNGRCTWLVVQALERATPTQKKILETHYGKNDLESVDSVRNLYESLELRKIYAMHQHQIYNRIHSNIKQISQNRPRKLLFNLLESLRT